MNGEVAPFACCIAVSLLVSAKLVLDILSIFCDGFMVQCGKLMLSKFLHLCFFYHLTGLFVAKT